MHMFNQLCFILKCIILSYNLFLYIYFRFSGITAEMLKDVTTTIFQVQAVLLNMFSDTTILVGHSLESDLKALKIVHKFVVDTSILFPHKAGLPFKRALKTLATEYLQKIIQESGIFLLHIYMYICITMKFMNAHYEHMKLFNSQAMVTTVQKMHESVWSWLYGKLKNHLKLNDIESFELSNETANFICILICGDP